ncbi:MAG: hypothetical protein KKG06_02750 [Bacteroidetes bacterium]|nr:hypothetical protein [Bacteroidota bacterium]MBU1422096.1 hypothetical protein [Bacteroidota bacterium]
MKEKTKQSSHRIRDKQAEYKHWKHPGGKLRDLGPEALSTEELIAIIISTGYKGKSAEEVANDLLIKFGSLESLSNVPLSKLLEIKGLGDVKIIRIAATFEISRRLINEVIKKYGKKENKD